MSINSQSSDVSLAEEVTEEFNSVTEMSIKNHDNGDVNSNNQKVDNSNYPGILMNFPSAFKVQDSCNVQSSDDFIIYDVIKPKDIHVINLHVDRQLKPFHLLINQSNSWHLSENEEHRRKSILQYLMVSKDKQIEDEDRKRERFSSLSNFRNIRHSNDIVRCNSVDNLYGKSFYHIEDSPLSSSCKAHDSRTQDTCDGKVEDSSMKEIMEHLDFQVNQRNERSHFILSELLIQTIEFLYSDELLNRSVQNFTAMSSLDVLTSFNESDSQHNITSMRSNCDSINSHNIIQPTSKAEDVAVILVDEIMRISSYINVHMKFKRVLPSTLQLLLERLERQREFSSCDEHDRFRPSDLHVSTRKSEHILLTEAVQSETTDAMIKAAVESHSLPMNIPVGRYPIMGPNQCLPTYVASMIPPLDNRVNILKRQDNKCPGCHHSFSDGMARRLRLCHYYGFYFCSVCHCNTLMLIPAKILSSWDFTMQPVSCLARDLLQLIHSEPIFSIDHFSDKIRSTLRVLMAVVRFRVQDRLLLHFIETCRQGKQLKFTSSKFPSHWLLERNQMFSIADFQLMESGTMEHELKSFAAHCIEHISICPLCQAHGFMCELCDNKDDIIFPFEMEKVSQCEQCHACFHVRCFSKLKGHSCPRCERRKARQQQMSSCDQSMP